ncbi:gliding motility-associated C-terminal domain-containing protein [Robiginitalea myxolifaciens]|uniref:Gliding motility-associated C-terminal domain-containing protein n=1 Tax=Robiginitalea myxolifaciens TaxID=400055 RepID=A0A1I6FPX3_9FLAO|nr:gliding motility-associated C-terminal domain-containing protein [Robiginitalea myxolifaciens]SFR31991.1 gliding motility-associated C-terminal domain-containing protein [Robiginitalea myxolifaciens]
MRFAINIALIFLGGMPTALAQPALQHYGGMQMHDGAQVGMHTDLVNEAVFDQNQGLLGFYGDNTLVVSGSVAPGFFDVEIAAPFGVELQLPLLIGNNLNFIIGDFRTDRALADRYIGMLQNGFTNGESDASKVDGFALFTQQSTIVFPVGDIDQLRPLTYQAGAPAAIAKCAYFRDDPTNSAQYGFLDPTFKPPTIENIGTREFWRLEADQPGTVTLTWNPDSDLELLTDDLGKIELVGWDKASSRWVPIGTATRAGDLQNGFAISETIVPDEYEVLTFAGLGEPEELLDLPNYYLSPNGDNINDFLVIEELIDSPNNELRIYDRRGLLVYTADNYTGDFQGISNTNNLVVDRDAGLPEGIYFYIVRMLDLNLEYQGFLYLRR